MLRFDLTPDAHLRLWEESDAEELHALIGANRDHLAPWMPFADQPFEKTREFVRDARRAIGEQKLLTAIVAHDRIVGSIGTDGIGPDGHSTHLGYWLAADATGRGLATLAARAYIDHCFGTWRLERVGIRVATGNARSRAVAERLGFAHEGTLRRQERVAGAWQDIAIYGLLRDEWATASSPPPAAP